MNIEVGTYLRVWDDEGGLILCDVLEESSIDAAVEQWISSGRQRDTILHLALAGGSSEMVMLASTITSWMISTPESRRRSAGWDAALKAEEKEFSPAWEDDG